MLSLPVVDLGEGPLIGILDSGRGGLTLIPALRHVFPGASFIYKGDTEFFPYGEKSSEDIRQRTAHLLGLLKEKGVALTVLACYTSSSCCWPFLEPTGRGFSLFKGFPVWDMVSLTAQALKKTQESLEVHDSSHHNGTLESRGENLRKSSFGNLHTEAFFTPEDKPRRLFHWGYGPKNSSDFSSVEFLGKDYSKDSFLVFRGHEEPCPKEKENVCKAILKNPQNHVLGDAFHYSERSLECLQNEHWGTLENHKVNKIKNLGVLCTPRTHEEGILKKHLEETLDIPIYSVPCPNLANWVEEGNSIESYNLLKTYLKEIPGDINDVAYGCTHYTIIHGFSKK